MPMTDNKTFGWNISFKQVIGLLAVAILVVATIYSGKLAVGYVVMTLSLCVFFIVVAFDIGLPTKGDGRES